MSVSEYVCVYVKTWINLLKPNFLFKRKHGHFVIQTIFMYFLKVFYIFLMYSNCCITIASEVVEFISQVSYFFIFLHSILFCISIRSTAFTQFLPGEHCYSVSLWRTYDPVTFEG